MQLTLKGEENPRTWSAEDDKDRDLAFLKAIWKARLDGIMELVNPHPTLYTELEVTRRRMIRERREEEERDKKKPSLRV